MTAMVVVMVMFLVMSGHHGFSGSHKPDTNRPAESAPHTQHDEGAKPEEQRR